MCSSYDVGTSSLVHTTRVVKNSLELYKNNYLITFYTDTRKMICE